MSEILAQITAPHMCADRASVDEALKVEADLLRSEGIDPAWPGFPDA